MTTLSLRHPSIRMSFYVNRKVADVTIQKNDYGGINLSNDNDPEILKTLPY